jgi:hypothetical protein
MNCRLIVCTAALALATSLLFLAAPLQTTPALTPGALAPAGPILCLESRNFAGDLAAWNSSAEQKAWLASTRYEGFSKSRLYLRLQEAWTQFNEAAGFSADSPLLSSIAGRESALALYDIGDLAFLYITRLPTSRAMQTLLWQSRMKYETRNAAGVEFYVRRGGGSREVAFAATGDWLIIGTREEYVAGALRLLARENYPAVRQEAWYTQAVAAAGPSGDLRLVMNLDAIVKAPHFRSYWIQRNVSEIRPFWAAVADIHRTADEIREDRVLLRRTPGTAAAATLDIARLAPDDSGFYEAWSEPDAKAVAALIERKLFAPPMRLADSGRYAPVLDTQAAGPGAETDLETRIDQPVLRTGGEPTADLLAKFLSTAQLRAVLQIGSARTLSDDVFAATPAVIAIQAEQAWDPQAVRQALTAAAANLWTLDAIGAGWTQRGQIWSCEGLAQLHVAVQGDLLLLASASSDLEASLGRLSRTGGQSGVVYQAAFRHQHERPEYDRIMTMLDQVRNANEGDRWPFFSSDLASLSDVFARVTEMQIEIRDAGAGLREQVRYRTR